MKARILKPKIKEGMLVRLPHLEVGTGYIYFKIHEINLSTVYLNPVLVRTDEALYKVITNKDIEIKISELLDKCTYLDEFDEFELQLKLIPAHDI